MDNEDTYISVFEALKAAAWKHDVGVEIIWIDSEELERGSVAPKLKKVDGIVVPGGFGSRGVEGKIKAAQYALKQKVPYLGLCLGMQVGVIALARSTGIKDATTSEIEDNADNPVIHIMEDQVGNRGTGGSMRLGNYTCVLNKKSLAAKLYGEKAVEERHRHRFEFNNSYRQQLEDKGLIVAGESPDGNLVELIEMQDHPFFMASQYHPELKSRPMKPHPMFDGFIAQLKRSAQ